MPSKTYMGPVAKHIRKTFEDKKAYDEYKDSLIPGCKPVPMCNRVPFDIWMNDYLFPELLQLGDINTDGTARIRSHSRFLSGNSQSMYNWACYFLPEETVLRIMVEAGIID